MGRPKKKEYWNQVMELRNNAWKCKHCGREFKGGASRIKAHVDRIEGRGIEVCKRSIDHNQQEAVNVTNPGEVAEGGNEMIVANTGGSMDHQINPESEFINLFGDLGMCFDLKYVPALEKLQALLRLDISSTSVEEVRGLENLINLKWLDLSCNRQLRLTPGSVLPGLTNLQYLNLSFSGYINVKVEDVEGMGMLECFGGNFHDGEDYNNYVRPIQNGGYGPKTYLLSRTEPGSRRYVGFEDFPRDDEYSGTVVFEDCQEFPHLLPTDIARLKITGNDQWISLCGTLLPSRPSSLRMIEITFCKQLESLFCSSFTCSLCPNIGNLESLHLESLGSLIVICKEDVAHTTSVPLPPEYGVFSHLKHFRITFCAKIETLLMPVLLSQLQNLEAISVRWCHSVREMFAMNSSDGGGDGASSITLPKLTELELYSLPLLEVVCRGIIICESLPKLTIVGCPKLERVPTIQVSS